MSDVTRILNAIEQGDARAADELLPLVYNELRQLAAQKLVQEKPGQTLQATALVHEAYIRLVQTVDQHWNGRGHFFMAAAEAMRRILVEHARYKQRVRHGGEHKRVEINEAQLAVKGSSEDMIALNEALEKLSKKDKVKAELVNLRYFAGLTGKQAANILNISHSTADEYWAYTRAWLRTEITKGDEITEA
jgi:RNA polymerase sigma factor (TIGR02999 family)